MVEDSLLHDYYKSLRYERSYKQVSMIMRMLAEKLPNANILEIGTGTGGCTRAVLDSLQEANSANGISCSRFDFTDISSGFFKDARRKFGDRSSTIAYQKLNIEEDPIDQGFEAESYDLIIASGVLHATKVMKETLENVRRLLKPCGRLALVEITRDTIELPIVFGTLPGWWLNLERQDSPNFSAQAWERLLIQAGFSGLDVEVGDCEKEHATVSVMLSTAIQKVHSPTRVSLVCSPRSLISQSGLDALRQHLEKGTGYPTEIKDMKSAMRSTDACVILDDGRTSLLEDMSPTKFEEVRDLLTCSRGLLWITAGAIASGGHPGFALPTGLLRTLRMESHGRKYISLDIDPTSGNWDKATGMRTRFIVNALELALDSSRNVEPLDFEFAEKNGKIHVQRLTKIPDESSTALATWAGLQGSSSPGPDVKRDVFVDISSPGMLDTLHFTETALQSQKIPPGYVEVRTEAFGMNFRDVMTAMGQINDGGRLGLECSGVVTKIGAGSSSHIIVGDRVCVIGGHWSTFVQVPSTNVACVPLTMTFEEAASIPTVFLTAYYAFYHIARLVRGETVLIHAGSGGVGQAAIMLAQKIGAEVYTTAGSPEKREIIHRKYGISHDHIFSSRDSSFLSRTMTMTKGKGVDVVLNSLSGALLHASWSCIGRFGRFVEIGKKDIHSSSFLDMELMRRAASFAAVDLIQLAEYRGKLISEILAEIMRLLEQGKIHPVSPVKVFTAQELEKAFREMQMGKHMGKLVIKPTSDDVVKFTTRSQGPLLSQDDSYLMVGSVNGVGRNIAQWMTENGGTHVVFISRNAESSKTIRELKDANVHVFARNCDISNRDDLERVLAECALTMPPFRGVFQGAMVLQDSVFENMSFDEWRLALQAKVQCTWNLHHALPNLDFCIMLSSLLGVIGNPGQANYTAAGAFQDAFARHRIAKGLPAVSIDLGAIATVGYVAERNDVSERLRKVGHREIPIEDVLKVIKLAVQYPRGVDHQGQLLTGVFPFSDESVAWRHDKRFSTLRASATENGIGDLGTQQKDDTLESAVALATSQSELIDMFTKAILEKVASIFALPINELSPSASLSHYGVDSLVAVELRNWLLTAAQVEVSIADIMQSASVAVLAEVVAEGSRRFLNAADLDG